jgi:transcriptional regulator with XRE-family HTH domain
MSRKEWSEFIQKLLTAFDMAPEDLAERIGRSTRTVLRWTQDEGRAQPGSMLAVAKAFGCSLSELRAKVESELKMQRHEKATEIGGRDLSSLSGFDYEVEVLRFLNEPGNERRRLLEELPSLVAARLEAKSLYKEAVKKGRDLMESLTKVEDLRR